MEHARAYEQRTLLDEDGWDTDPVLLAPSGIKHAPAKLLTKPSTAVQAPPPRSVVVSEGADSQLHRAGGPSSGSHLLRWLSVAQKGKALTVTSSLLPGTAASGCSFATSTGTTITMTRKTH